MNDLTPRMIEALETADLDRGVVDDLPYNTIRGLLRRDLVRDADTGQSTSSGRFPRYNGVPLTEMGIALARWLQDSASRRRPPSTFAANRQRGVGSVGGGAVEPDEAEPATPAERQGADGLELGDVVTISVTTAVTQATVRRAIENKAILIDRATSLADFIEWLMEREGAPSEGRNTPVLTEKLGVPEELAEGELLRVLKEIHDALRELNSALANQRLEPGTLRRLANIWAEAFVQNLGATLGRGVGGVIYMALGATLQAAGIFWG